eukprot:gnl/TRDRNA2_/TRDRNA2_169825_c0_seq1.p1 gnl/TRDRNA2_/TRDRNA2_169825_c0~~gnl/TRDRNA2_/TRDRNA2_169825_c0_seq1.p1  ORF type:complete len:271 (+),score=46.26 gnl/TRDRNA2_/TRDRNA2_169825_c0_seq1:1-813(+)
MGCVLYSVGVAVKMSVILYAPALGILLLHELGLSGLVCHVGLCAFVQLVMGAPFLAASPSAYISAAFNFGRTFKHKWSVNFKWVPCDPRPESELTLLQDCDGVFTSRPFATALLLLHVTLLLWLAHRHWLGPSRGGLGAALKNAFVSAPSGPVNPIGPRAAARALFAANFVGVAFARSLHFQFYVWYFYSLPLLAWSTCLPSVVNVALLIGIEAAWNPWAGETSSVKSSILLTACHLVLLVGLLAGPPAKELQDEELQESEGASEKRKAE